MKISLKNFRCYDEAVFDLPDQGLVALSGGTGAGKSTILSAITYAFYGKIPGKVKKPHRSKCAKVVIEYQNMVITRISKPKSITVSVTDDETVLEYEGDAAESIIVTTLGMNYEEFLAGAYIVQRSNASVLSMTPTEQVKFVEVLAETQRVSEFKELVKDKIKEIKTLKLKNQGEIESLQAQLDEKRQEVPEEIPETPKEILEGFDPEKAREEIKSLDLTLKKIQKNLQDLSVKLNEARESEKEKIVVEKKINVLETEIKQLYGILSKIKDVPTKKSIELLEEDLKTISDQIKFYETGVFAFKELSKLEDAIQDFLTSSEQTLASKENPPSLVEISQMEKNVVTAETLKKEYLEKKAEFDFEMKRRENARKEIALIFKEIKSILPSVPKDVKSPGKMIEILTKVISSIRHKAKNLIYLTCPLCQNDVCYDTASETLIEKLSCIENELSDIPEDISLERLEKYLEDLSSQSKNLSIPRHEDPGPEPEDPMVSQKILLRAKRARDDYLILKKSINDARTGKSLPPVLSRMKNRVDDAISSYQDWDLVTLEAEHSSSLQKSEDMKKQLSQAREAFAVREEHLSVIKTKENAHKVLTAKLAKLGSFSKTKELETTISKKTQLLMTTQNSISKIRDTLDSIADYETYQTHLGCIEDLENRLAAANQIGSELDTRMEGFLGLGEAGRESEIVSLEKTVNSINEHAKIYLEQMFEQVPLVRLECVKNVKSSKTDKLQMNTAIDYKGEKYESIEELSGGERQRCDIAFLLAINDIVGAQILLLDECLNNLDEEVNTETLTMIKEMCADKLIIVVSHEAVKGIFDFIVEV